MRRVIARVAAAMIIGLGTLTATTPAQADVSGTWTNTGALSGSDCPTTWSGDSSYSVPNGSIIKINLAAGGQAGCSVTIKSADLSTWQVSLDSGATWTTLFGTYEGLGANGGPTPIWFRVGLTSATIGSGDYSDSYGANFQNPVISITPVVDKGSAELTFTLPDGTECGSISPVSVPIDSSYVLPGPGADCKTSAGSEVIGWKVGWDDLVHPPGHTVLVVDSQRFTAVVKEEVLEVVFDANVAAADPCLAGGTDIAADNRASVIAIDRDDLSDYRLMNEPVCTPPRHYFAGWNTKPVTELLPLGAKAPSDWSATSANSVTLVAEWKPQPIEIIDIPNFPTSIPQLPTVQVLVGDITLAGATASDPFVTVTSFDDAASATSTMSVAMVQAIEDFFLNGGQSLVLVPAGGSEAADLSGAINALNVPNALDLAAPEMRALPTSEWLSVANALVSKANEIQAMAWIDPPSSVVSVPEEAQAVNGVIALAAQLRARVGSDATAGTLLGGGVSDSAGKARAASPATLGARSRADEQEGVWTPMGPYEALADVTPEVALTITQPGLMSIYGVSPIIDLADHTLVAPVITLDRLVRTTNRRFEDWMQLSLTAGLAPFAKFPNGRETQVAMITDISGFLGTLWSYGALAGNTASEAYQVNCTATAQQIKSGVIECVVTYAPVFPGMMQEITIMQPVQPGLPTADDPDPATVAPAVANPPATTVRPGVVAGD